MNYSDDSKFNAYYEQHCKHLSLKGLRPKTIEAYARVIRRIGGYFDGNLDNLTQNQLLDYFMLTFTLPAQFRFLARRYQRLIYGILFFCVWETIKTFCLNDKRLGGIPGVIVP